MPARLVGTYFKTKTNGWAVRWPEERRKRQKSGFRNKTEAQKWFEKEKRPQLERGGPSPEITFDEFCALFLERHGATVAPRTRATLEERLGPAREHFGSWKLSELEGAGADIARWRASLPEGSRYRLTHALRAAFKRAVEWRYLLRNPAVDAGRNPKPRRMEAQPFEPHEVDAIAAHMGPLYGPLVVFAAETGLRPEEWRALERRDIDRASSPVAVRVQRKYASGVLSHYPKTKGSRRRVPLTPRALAAIDSLPPRLDTPLLFPAPSGGYINLDNWRSRVWYPALKAAGTRSRGPYHLRHTFATEALAGGVTLFDLARTMGNSGSEIEATYGHPASDAEARILAALEKRGQRRDVFETLDGDGDA